MTSLDPRAPPEGTLLDGKYRLIRFLAQGGMGAVYEAQGPNHERLAVKVMLDTSKAARESGAWARFVREAEVSSSLSSGNIVKVAGGGIDPDSGAAYLAMEFLVGEDMEGLVGRVGPLNPQVAVRLILQAAKGIEVAHRAGIVHRDIKPSNLFLEVKAGEVTVKVCDFGIAKVHPSHDQQHLTGTGHVLGSPLYMAPEQVLSSKRVDARADVWSLAMSLYHALAGDAPLAEFNSIAEVILAITSKPIPPLQERAPWVPGGLAMVVHGALLRGLDARCPDISAFVEALQAHAGGGDEVTAGMLVGLTSEQRAERTASAELPASWGEAVAKSKGPDPLLGKTLAGRYELLRTLGEGGMGAVYEARTERGDLVACKVIRPDLVGSSPDAMRRLVREARVAMSIESEHVVKMTEVDTDMTLGLPFIAMELLRGFDLAALVQRVGPLAPAAACRLFADACKGLSAAHELGVIHRDIKPANLFLHSLDGSNITVKICDFGIAKQTSVDGYEKTSTELTRTGGLLGSPLYMSPEQARNAKNVDVRTDIWSLAMSLYEALAGQKAWVGFNSPGELVLAICTQDVRPLQDVAPWVTPTLADVVHRGLRRTPQERYATVAEFARALEPHAASCPVLTSEALASLSEAQKSVVAERSPLSRRSVTEATSADVTRDTPPPPRRKPAHLAVAAVSLLAVGGGLWVARGGSETREKTASALVAPVVDRVASALPSVTPVQLSVRLPISPPEATVSVNGKPRPLENGALVLQGDPGESFLVLVETEHGKRETQVTLTRDGKASPPSIEGAARTAAKSDPRSPKAAASPGTRPPPPSTKPEATKPDLGPQKDWR